MQKVTEEHDTRIGLRATAAAAAAARESKQPTPAGHSNNIITRALCVAPLVATTVR